MPKPYGVTPAGFSLPEVDELNANLAARQREKMGIGYDTSAEAPAGQHNGISAGALREVWEGLQSIWASKYVLTASGVSLKERVKPMLPLPASKSQVVMSVSVEPGTYAPGTLIVNVVGDSTRQFSNVAQVQNATMFARTINDVLFQATVTGPVVANANTLTVISVPVVGFIAANNENDASLGRDDEKDPQIRSRWLQFKAASAGSSLIGVYSALMNTTGVVSVSIFENIKETFDPVLGLPPKSFEAVVYDGSNTGTIVSNATIAAVLLKSAAAGMGTQGTISQVVADSSGTNRTMKFSRPTVVEMHVRVYVTVSGTRFPSDGVTQIQTAVALYGDSIFGVGAKVTPSKFNCEIYKVPGVSTIEKIEVSSDGVNYTDASLSISSRQLPDFDTSRVYVIKQGFTA